MREKLIELLEEAEGLVNNGEPSLEQIADYLISHGVTIPVLCKKCRYYNEDNKYCGFWGECRHPEHFCDEGVEDDG